ncbi:hypothetical protein [Glycomyces arizonensis]|uniref:hypothetical protein n=1 Tax=Glycomyces arizonensis TaxID=256035 RepID=UPI000556BCB1|nr:hypothetical protein [Glycomyces arizonensis]
MSKDHAVVKALHEATHRMPGLPRHQDHPEGHHGRSLQNRPLRDRGTGSHQGSAPAHDRPPRMLAGWQRRIAALFSRTSD